MSQELSLPSNVLVDMTDELSSSQEHVPRRRTLLPDAFCLLRLVAHPLPTCHLAVSTLTNLGSMLLLTKMQRNASYPTRVSRP